MSGECVGDSVASDKIHSSSVLDIHSDQAVALGSRTQPSETSKDYVPPPSPFAQNGLEYAILNLNSGAFGRWLPIHWIGGSLLSTSTRYKRFDLHKPWIASKLKSISGNRQNLDSSHHKWT
jgi:hypothetical protein